MNVPRTYYCPFCFTEILEFYLVCSGCGRFMNHKLLLQSLPAVDNHVKNKHNQARNDPEKRKVGPDGKNDKKMTGDSKSLITPHFSGGCLYLVFFEKFRLSAVLIKHVNLYNLSQFGTGNFAG